MKDYLWDNSNDQNEISGALTDESMIVSAEKRKHNRSLKAWLPGLAALLIAVMLAGYLVWPSPTSITELDVQMGSLEQEEIFDGTIEYSEVIEFKSDVDGILSESVAVGEQINVGDIVFTIDDGSMDSLKSEQSKLIKLQNKLEKEKRETQSVVLTQEQESIAVPAAGEYVETDYAPPQIQAVSKHQDEVLQEKILANSTEPTLDSALETARSEGMDYAAFNSAVEKAMIATKTVSQIQAVSNFDQSAVSSQGQSTVNAQGQSAMSAQSQSTASAQGQSTASAQGQSAMSAQSQAAMSPQNYSVSVDSAQNNSASSVQNRSESNGFYQVSMSGASTENTDRASSKAGSSNTKNLKTITSTENEISNCEATIKSLTQKIDGAKIKSNSSGMVISAQMPGMKIAKGDKLLTLSAGGLVIRAGIPADKLNDLKEGMKVQLRTDEISWIGEIAGITETGIEIGVPPDFSTDEGVAVDISMIEEDSASNYIIIPEDGLTQDLDGEYVLINMNGILVRRDVVTGEKRQGMVVIESGLAQGEKIVFNPDLYSVGEKVKAR